MDELLERLRYFLCVPLTATAEEITAELTKLIGQIKAGIGATTVEAANLPAIITFVEGQRGRLVTASEEIASIIAAMGLPATATAAEAKVKIIAASDSLGVVGQLQTEVQNLRNERLMEKFDGVIHQGMQSGRITPAMKANTTFIAAARDFAKADFAGFSKYYTQEAPVVIPVEEVVLDSTVVAASDGSLSEMDRQVADKLKIPHDKMKGTKVR